MQQRALHSDCRGRSCLGLGMLAALADAITVRTAVLMRMNFMSLVVG